MFFSVNIFIRTEDGIAEKFLFFEINLFTAHYFLKILVKDLHHECSSAKWSN